MAGDARKSPQWRYRNSRPVPVWGELGSVCCPSNRKRTAPGQWLASMRVTLMPWIQTGWSMGRTLSHSSATPSLILIRLAVV